MTCGISDSGGRWNSTCPVVSTPGMTVGPRPDVALPWAPLLLILVVFVSPGLSWNFSRDAQLYGFVQLPIYQAVNGVQLTARWSALAGVSLRF